MFAGKRIDGLAPEKIVALGIAHVPEGRRVFPGLTVEENLRTGAFLRHDHTEVAKDLDEVFQHFPRLKERRKQWARSLSGGEQQMLAIGRALMSRPKMLVLDEPSMGLSPVMVQEIARIVRDIVHRGVPVVLVEQNAELALRLARSPTCSRPEASRCKGRRTSSTITRISGGPISVAETWSVQELLSAGWSEADLSGKPPQSRRPMLLRSKTMRGRRTKRAGRARAFRVRDHRSSSRRASPITACAYICPATAGLPLFREASEVWRRHRGSHAWMPAGGAELALSYAHGGTSPRYLPGEMARALEGDRRGGKVTAWALDAPHDTLDASAAESLARWRRERPAMLNDTRKLMAAALLLAPPA